MTATLLVDQRSMTELKVRRWRRYGKDRLYVHGADGVRVGWVDLPTALAVFPRDLTQPPRSWAERTYNITRYTRMSCGGHFAAHEEPALLADDLQQFFTDLR